MPGEVGNPNHDPKTGRFASASGLNKSNSTVIQRGQGRLREAASSSKKYLTGAAGIAAAGIGYAILRGVTVPVQRNVGKATQAGIDKATAHVDRIVAAHGPAIEAAIKAKGSNLINHVKNMKKAGAVQHRQASVTAKSSTYSGPRASMVNDYGLPSSRRMP